MLNLNIGKWNKNAVKVYCICCIRDMTNFKSVTSSIFFNYHDITLHFQSSDLRPLLLPNSMHNYIPFSHKLVDFQRG
jgi:hypothetical protein